MADFDASVDRVWQLWADPRLLEQWWGPPTHPATVKTHDLTPGGEVTYYMTLPDGGKYHGWWQITSVTPPTSLEYVDGFADNEGNRLADAPMTTVRMDLAEHDGGARMVVRSVFASRDHMDQLVQMGAVDTFVQTVGQMDALLAR